MAVAKKKSLISTGFSVNPEVAREYIRKYAEGVHYKVSFLDAFDEFVEPNTVIGAHHRIIVGPGVVTSNEYYLVGKTTKQNDNGNNHEVTLRGANIFTEFLFEFNELSFLMGINYEGDDVNFRQSDSNGKNWLNFLRIRTKGQHLYFPLADRRYGATIAASKDSHYRPVLGIRDQRLEDIAKTFFEGVKVVLCTQCA